ncbi:unnamed protein product [Ectocarpus sp. 6 AP-2014]
MTARRGYGLGSRRAGNLLLVLLSLREAIAEGEQQGPRRAAPHADRDTESHGRPHRPGVPAGGEFDLKLSASRLQRSESTDHLMAASELARLRGVEGVHELSAMRADATASLGARVAQRDNGERPMEEADDATRAAAAAITTAVTVPAGHGNSGSRRLQADESCEVGASFELSSTLYSAYNGCYASLDSTLDPYFFWTESFDAFIGPAPSIFASTSMDFTTSDNPLAWKLGEVVAIGSDGEIYYSMACESFECVAIGSHPSDVTQWICYLAGGWVFVSADSFSLTCGCSDNPTPAPESGSTTPSPAHSPTSILNPDGTTPAPATSPVDDDGSPEGASGCSGTDEFTISSSELEEFDGCYVDAGETETFFSTSGEKADGVMAVFPGFLDEQETADARWIVGTYAEDADDRTVTCVSDESPTTAHPADSTFSCDLTGTGAFITVTDVLFGFTCGCTSASAGEGDDDEATTTPSPTETERSIDDTLAPTTSFSPSSPAPVDLAVGLDPSTPSPESDKELDTAANGGRGQHAAPGVLFILSGVGGLFVGLVGAIVAAL